MDFELEEKWRKVQGRLKEDLGEDPDLTSVIFLIGVQELGMGYLKFTKRQKLEVMHIAVCRLLEPYGYYTFAGVDAEGWPHYENTKKLPPLDGRQQQHLLKQAVIEYFEAITEG